MTVWFDKGRERWRYDFWHQRKRHIGYCDQPDGTPARNRRQALAAEAAARVAANKAAGLVEAPPSSYTLAMALSDYVEHHAQYKRNWPDVKRHIAELLAFFGAATPVAEMTLARIDDYIEHARAQPKMTYVGTDRNGEPKWRRQLGRRRSDARVNRYLVTLKAALNHAARRRETTGVVHVPIIPKLEEPRDLPRAIPDDDLAAILKAAVPHLRDIVTVCVHTGMRQREVLTLRKDQVSLADRVIYLDSSTTGKRGRAAYINKVVYQILRRWLDLDPMAKQVFTYRPKVKGANGKRTEALPRPWGSLKKAWEGALKRAGLSGRYRFHDLRVTRGTALHRLGVGPIDIQHMLGHSSITTTLRYVQASNDRQRAAVEALAQNSRTTKVPHESLTRPKRRTLANGLTH